MKQYHDMLRRIFDNGVESDDRTGVGTLSVFGYQNRYDLSQGFPIITTKRIPFRHVVEELLWFLSGSTDVNILRDKGVSIWNANAEEFASRGVEWFPRFPGDCGRLYPAQWRDFGGYDHEYNRKTLGFDQIAWLVNEIMNNPSSRRLIVTAWNPQDIPISALPSCHALFQVWVRNGYLSLQMYQRSADAFLGVPWNISSYSLLAHILAHVCGLKVGEFVHTFGDLHIYKNHVEQCRLQLSREPYQLPTLEIDSSLFGSGLDGINKIIYENISLINYKHHPSIRGEMSV